MARALSEISRRQPQSRPRTDYERWLVEQGQSYVLDGNPRYHPPITPEEDENVANDSPPQAFLKSSITRIFWGSPPGPLALFLLLFAFFCAVKTVTKRRRRRADSLIPETAKSPHPGCDEKHLV